MKEEKQLQLSDEASIKAQQTEAQVSAGIQDVEYGNIFLVADLSEKIMEAERKIKLVCLKYTNERDWILFDGTPYMKASRAEAIAKMFGISIQILEIQKETAPDKYIYTTKLRCFNSKREIEVIGTASTDDPFFCGSKDRRIPISDIREENVKKKSYTNALNNGICRMLGIRNILVDDLKLAGLDIDKIQKVEHKKKEKEKKQVEEEEISEKEKFEQLKQEFKKLCLENSQNEDMARELSIEVSSFEKDGRFVVGKVMWEMEYTPKNWKWLNFALKRLRKQIGDTAGGEE